MAEEGYNLAFIFNSGSAECPRGLSCISSDLGNIIVAGFEKTLKTELPLYEKYSLEEFELLRQSLHERHIQVVRDMKEYMETKGTCNQCTKYLMRSVETKTALKVDELDVGFWTPAGPYLKDDLLPNVKGHFRGRTIPIGSVHYPPWQVLKKDRKGKIIGTSGIIFEILDQISYQMNFSYIVREPADGQWGIQTGGQWSGMINQLINDEVVVAAAAFAVSHERRQVVNFTEALDIQPYAFMYRRPKQLSKALLFISPFTPYVWLGIGVLTLLIGPFLYLVHRASPYYTYTETVNQFGFFNLPNCVFYCYGALLQQGALCCPWLIPAGFWWPSGGCLS